MDGDFVEVAENKSSVGLDLHQKLVSRFRLHLRRSDVVPRLSFDGVLYGHIFGDAGFVIYLLSFM